MTDPTEETKELVARDVLKRHGLEITDAGGFLYRANIAIGPAVVAAMLEYARLTADRERSVGEGFVLVPREPTEAMLEAGQAQGDDWWDDETPLFVWQRMLAATPPLPNPGNALSDHLFGQGDRT